MSSMTPRKLADTETGSYDEQDFELYVSKGSHIQGVFYVRGMARIDGYFEGEIHTDRTLHIGRKAVIVADIYANCLIAKWAIRGDVIPRQQVALLSPATVDGDI